MPEISERVFDVQNINKYLIDFILNLADSSLIMGHRLSEWTGHGPTLEQDIAMTNISLDLIGQSRNFYQYAAELSNRNGAGETTEDSLAFLRDANEYRNFLLTELPNGDWGQTILKIFFFSSWLFELYEKMVTSSDEQLAAIAEKSLKEVTYHVHWSGEWVIRLGDGTKESNLRMHAALNDIWPYTAELFGESADESSLAGANVIPPLASLETEWQRKIVTVLEEATLEVAAGPNPMLTGGKKGIHTEHLGYLLAEMQFLQRAYPGCNW